MHLPPSNNAFETGRTNKRRAAQRERWADPISNTFTRCKA